MKKLILSLFCLLGFFSVSHAVTVQPPQSGQKSIIAKSDDGDIRAGQDWPTPRFTQNDNLTASDHLTGLMWAKNANVVTVYHPDKSSVIAGGSGAVSWQSALDLIKRLNTENYLGYSDWRLPNLNELASLLNQEESRQSTWLGQQGFINAMPGNYWTSTSVAYNASQSWVIHFAVGNVEPLSKTSTALIWPVRGKDAETKAAVALPKTGQIKCYNESGEEITCKGTGQDGELRTGAEWPVLRFSQNDDQTVTDNVTGLVWAKSANLIVLRDPFFGSTANGKVLWHDALDYVSRLNRESYLGYSDWRLPNRNEMVSLVNYAETNPANWITIQGINNPQLYYWSSTTSASSPPNAWNVELSGSVTERSKYDSTNGSFVWPVRGAQTKSSSTTAQIAVNTVPAPSSPVILSATPSATAAAPMAAAGATLMVATTTLPAGIVSSTYSQTLTATGGTTPYTWTRTTGSLPAGLTLSTIGVISGTPTTAATSTFTVQVKDKVAATATKSLSITVNAAPLSITTTSLADGYLTTAYSKTLTATGGKTAYTWSKTAGTLPAGLSLGSTGIISGTPTATGTGSFTVQVKDANNTTATKALTITIYALPSINTTSLPAGNVGVPYNQSLTATGGKTAYSWSISSGTLPAGLTLVASTGVISGIPTTSGTSSVTFKVTDANVKTATKALSITINATPPTINTTTLADGYVTVSYSQTLAATGGKTPYTWSRTAGSLPAGLSFSSAGVISGTPTTAGTSTFTVQVKDANNATATAPLTITIVTAVSVASTTLPAGSVGSSYSQTLAASGGKMPYVWSIDALPAGLSLNTSTGAISGTPIVAGSTSITAQVKDANNKTAFGSIDMTINLPVSVTTSTLHDSFIGIAYNHALAAIGGVGPYVWSISNGTVPSGMTLDPATGVISGIPNVTGTSNFTVQVSDSGNATAANSYSLVITDFGLINGIVTDQTTGNPMPGVQVTIGLTGIKSRNSNDQRFSCNGTPIIENGYSTLAENDAVKLDCRNNGAVNTMQFKTRNPYGVVDSFRVSWNGISSITDHVEFLAQSFKPTISGNLTKVSLYLPNGTQSRNGGLSAQLKTSLGGDRDTHLAQSPTIEIYGIAVSGAAWVDLTFPTPVVVVAGQTYYIEVQGGVWQGDALSSLYFGDGATYADGEGYQKYAGSWQKLNRSLAFRSYIDDQLNVSILPANNLQFSMSGGASQRMNMALYKTSLPADWNYGGTVDVGSYQQNLNTYGYLYNGDDLAIYWDVNSGLGDYYDQNGWITVKVDNHSFDWIYPPSTNLVTDQYSLTFNHTYSTTTDSNGAYSFPALPDGNYTVTYGGARTSSGVLNPGAQLNVNVQLPSLPPMAVNFTSPSDRTLVNSTATITVSGTTSSNTIVRVNGVQATVTNTTFSAAIPLTEGLNTISATATNQYGQSATSSITVIYNATPRLVAAPATLNFGALNNGDTATLSALVTNTSAANLVLGMIARPPAPFWIIADNCSGATLLPAASCSVSAQFMPTAPGTFTSEFAVPLAEAIPQHLAVALKGTTLVFNGFYLPDAGQAGEAIRNPISYSLNSADMATDDNTKLMWQRNAPAPAMNWADAGTYCNNLSIDGLSGWRLPNLIELVSIQHYGVFDPTIDRTVFPLTNSGNYWTSVSVDYPIPNARTVNFLYGEAQLTDKSATAFVRCVRGTALAASVGLSGDGSTLHDENTGLDVMRDYLSTWGKGWNQLPGLCSAVSSSSYGGFNDWRVPTIKELALLDDFGWSSTSSYNGNLSKALVASSGLIYPISKTDTQGNYSLRCVRGGNLYSAINGLTISDIGMSSATIQWVTNRSATGVVEYGESSAYGGTITDSNLKLQHAITLSGLKPATTYHYRAVSANTQGIFIYSADQTFTTAASNVTSLGDSGNVTVMEISGNLDAKNPDGSINDQPRKAVAKEYFKTHADVDFLIFLSTFDYALPEAGAQGFYLPVRNDTQGINQAIMDNSAAFGSQGKLQGTIDMGNVSMLAANPYGPKLDETLIVLNHEIGHRFCAYVRFKNPDGTLNTALLGKDNAHWSYLLDSTGSLMYGNGWKANGDGTFTSTSKQSVYSPLDLYLMGMIPKEQVPPMLLIDNSAVDKTQLPSLGATVTGTTKTITIDDIIAAEGERIPNAATAQKQFNVGFVLLTRAGGNTTAAAAAQAIETLRKAWAGRFAELTQGKASAGNIPTALEIAIDSPIDGAIITGPNVTVSGTVINTSGAETGVTVNGMPATVSGNRFIANHVPLQLGSNTLTVTATDANGLTAMTSRTVTAQAGNYIRISSNIESGTGPLNISLRLEGSFSITSLQVSYSGPVPVTLTPGASVTEYTATLTAEGTYTFTASAIGPDGVTYLDTVTITVMSRQQMETLLKGKWDGMKQKVITGDILGAGLYFSVANRDRFQAIFNDPSIEAATRLNEISAIEIYTIMDDTVQAGAIKQEDDGEYAYPINFTRDENGIWSIFGF